MDKVIIYTHPTEENHFAFFTRQEKEINETDSLNGLGKPNYREYKKDDKNTKILLSDFAAFTFYYYRGLNRCSYSIVMPMDISHTHYWGNNCFIFRNIKTSGMDSRLLYFLQISN